MNLGQRHRRILKALIDEYITTAEPVGSKNLAGLFNNEMSPATIRAVMAELESDGLLDKPHTSAGRVPSTAGYRFYVNELMQAHELTNDERIILNDALTLHIKELGRLMQETNTVLSGLMKYAAFMVSPAMNRVNIHRIDAVKIDDHSYVIVVVADTGLVRTRVVRLSAPIDGKTYHILMILLNDSLRDIPLSGDIPDIRTYYDPPPGANELLSEIYSFIRDLGRELAEREVHFGGIGNLLKHPEFHDIDRAEKIMDYLSNRESAKNIMNIGSQGEDMIISIGSENDGESLRLMSVLMSPYHMPGSGGGYIGLVGPTRMDYARVSARLRYFTDGLSRLLSQAFVDDGEESVNNENNME